jgi:hypothetical protein
MMYEMDIRKWDQVLTGVPDPIEKLVVAMEISLVSLQVLLGGRRVVGHDGRDLDRRGAIVHDAEVAIPATFMKPLNRVGPGSLAHREPEYLI